MIRPIGQRLLITPVVLLGLTVVTFVGIHALPGDAAYQLAGGDYATEARVEEVRQQLGLDQPLPVQYGRFLSQLLRGDLGTSIFSHRPVAEQIVDRLIPSFELAIGSLVVGLPLGFWFGAWAAYRRDSGIDHATTLTSLVGLAIPSFWLGIMLVWLFSVQLGWLPTSGRSVAFDQIDRTTGFVLVDAALAARWDAFVAAVRHLVLPVATLAMIPFAIMARFTRAAFLDVLDQDYMRTARAMGLRQRVAFWRYGTKNALLPLITIVSLLVPALLTGAVLVETVFAWPGAGRLLVDALTSRDFPVVLGSTLVFAVIYVLANLAADIAYTIADPRIRRL